MPEFIYLSRSAGYCVGEITDYSGYRTSTTYRCSLESGHPGLHIKINDGLVKAMWVDESEGGDK